MTCARCGSAALKRLRPIGWNTWHECRDCGTRTPERSTR